MNPSRRLIGAVLAAALAPCAAPLAAWAEARVAIPEPPPGKATIVFFRMAQWDIWFPTRLVLSDANTKIGDIGYDRYLVAFFAPGRHSFSVGRGVPPIYLEVEAGETYFVKLGADTAVTDSGFIITPAEQRQFDEISPKLKPAVDAPGSAP